MNRPVVYKMQSARTTREKLIATGLKAMLTQGYDGTGIGPILALSGVPKGSFYHYFASKDDFTAAVIDSYSAHYGALFERLQENAALTPLGRLHGYFEALSREIEDEFPHGGCLYGMLAQTIAMRSPLLQEKLSAVFQAWEARLTVLLTQAQAEGEIAPTADLREMVCLLMDAYEGAIVRMKAEGSTAAFQRFRGRISKLLDAAG